MAAKKPDPRRLVEIARQKLEELGVPCEAGDGEQLLTGSLPDDGEPISNPLDMKPLTGIRFYVAGHDKLHLTDPPAVAGVPPIRFQSRPDLASLREAIAAVLRHRVVLLGGLRERLQKLGFQTRRLARLAHVEAIVDLEMVGTVRVEADEDGVRLISCTSVRGGEPVSMGARSLNLDEFADPSDVEIFLTPIAEKALREKKPVEPTPKRSIARKAKPRAHRPTVALRESPEHSPTLGWLLDTLGPEPFARAKITLTRELAIDGQPGRLDVAIEGRREVSGEAFIGDEPCWQGPLTAAQLGDLETFLAGAIQRAEAQPTPAARPKPPSAGDTQGLIPPVAGETWVMDVQIEAAEGEEVRYIGLNARGERHGAPRILPAHAFQKVFTPHGAGHRMLVRVVAVDGSRVTYQRLNAGHEPVAAPREIALASFLATFVAEAAAF